MTEFDKEKEQCLEFFKVIGEDANRANDVIVGVLDKIKKGKLIFENGHELIGLKNQLFLSYLINLMHLMLKKVNGESIADSEDVWRMIEIRTVMEKAQTLESKLQYEIEKKLNAAINGFSKNDPLQLKANAMNLVGEAGDDDAEEEEDEEDDGVEYRKKKDTRSDIYMPPKLTAKHFDEDEPPSLKEEKLMEKARKKALRSSMMSELRREFTDEPEEIYEGRGYDRESQRHKMQEKKEYEEKYFTRKQLTKKEKIALRKMRSFTSDLSDITKFSDVAALVGKEGKEFLKLDSKKRKSKFSGKKSSKKRPRMH